MAFRYEVAVETPLAELFIHRFLHSIRERQCCEVFRLLTPDAPNIWKFRRDKDIFTVTFSEEAAEQRGRIIIESATMDLSEVIISTVQSGLSDYMVKFLMPLARIPRTELESRIRACLAALPGKLQP